MDNVIALIGKRVSTRTYLKRSVEPDKKEALAAFLDAAGDNPFGAQVRFAILESDSAPRKLGTYGFIKGAQTFMAACVKTGGRDIEGFGFAFERAILFATQLGLCTCWLGGTLSRGAFAKAMGLSSEILPAVSPVGYAAQHRSLTERFVARSAGARKRLPFETLFFDGGFDTPLSPDDERIRTCFEMVRIAPSASNKQPWRVVRMDGAYHFYMAKTRAYPGNSAFGFCMQRIDMGIAACHFSLSAQELGLQGGIVFDDPGLLSADQTRAGLEYSFTWR